MRARRGDSFFGLFFYVLDAPAGCGDAVCQELALLARTRFAKSPQLLAAFLAASGVLAREAPASFPRVAALARSVAGATVDAAPGAVTRALAFLRSLSAARAAVHESNHRSIAEGLMCAQARRRPRRGRAPRDSGGAVGFGARLRRRRGPRAARGGDACRGSPHRALR